MNNSQNKYEEEVSIFSLLWYCVSRWKSIVAIALIGLILGCGFAVVKSPTVSNEAGEVEKSTKLQITEELALFSEERMVGLQDYVAETRLLEFDAYNLYRGAISYKIAAPQVSLEAIYGALYSYIYNGQLFAELESGTGLYNANDLSNLVGCSAFGVENITVLSESTQGQMTFTITVLGQTEDEAKELLNQTQISVDGYLNKIQNMYTIADYAVFESAVTEGMSTNIADYQDKIRTKFTAEKETLSKYTIELESLQAQEGVDQTSEGGLSKETLVKYSVLGLIIGIILAVIVWGLIYLFGGKLYAVSNINEKFGIKSLGIIHDTQKLNAIDRWIAQKRSGVYSSLPIEEQRKIVLLNVKNELKKHDGLQNVFLVSSLGANFAEADVLKSGLETAGYQVQVCENVIGRSDALEQMTSKDTVVVLENKETSKIALVEAEISALKEFVENVLGMVIIGNRK